MYEKGSKIPFNQARYLTEVSESNPRKIQYIVMHDMEAPEGVHTAENVAEYFHTMTDGRQASAHFCVDEDSIVQCVQCKDVAWHAPGCNSNGIGIELAGYSRFSRKDWLNPQNLATLENAARLIAWVLHPKFHIDLKWVLEPADLVKHNGDPSFTGITTHATVSKAFHKSDHMDPGDGFPYNEFMEMIRKNS